MVVSAILLTALAPITGALFGASYGTSIRIGYEIIFPALFGDMINKQKNGKGAPSDAKATIKALHTMFTATGGVSAMEFGIEQGIELAKKKTESPEVQHMIDLSLGLTNEQIRKASLIYGGKQITDKDLRDRDLEDSQQIPGFATPPAEIDFIRQMKQNYPNTDAGNRKLWNIMERGNEFGKRNASQKKALIFIYKQRREEHPKLFASFDNPDVQGAIDRTSTGLVNQIATKFNRIKAILQQYKNAVGINKQRRMRTFLIEAKSYNSFVQQNRKRNLTIDTAKSLAAGKIIPRYG